MLDHSEKLTEVVNRREIAKKISEINLQKHLKYAKGLSKKDIKQAKTNAKEAKTEIKETKTDNDN